MLSAGIHRTLLFQTSWRNWITDSFWILYVKNKWVKNYHLVVWLVRDCCAISRHACKNFLVSRKCIFGLTNGHNHVALAERASLHRCQAAVSILAIHRVGLVANRWWRRYIDFSPSIADRIWIDKITIRITRIVIAATVTTLTAAVVEEQMVQPTIRVIQMEDIPVDHKTTMDRNASLRLKPPDRITYIAIHTKRRRKWMHIIVKPPTTQPSFNNCKWIGDVVIGA